MLKSTLFSTCNLLLEIGHAIYAVCALLNVCSQILLYMAKCSLLYSLVSLGNKAYGHINGIVGIMTYFTL